MVCEEINDVYMLLSQNTIFLRLEIPEEPTGGEGGTHPPSGIYSKY